MKCIQVLPILKYTFSEELTYWTVHDFEVGDMIQVELNKRKIFAIVSSIVSLGEAKEFIKSRDFKIKKIESYVKLDFFSKPFILACLHTARYYVESFGEVLSEYIPKKVLETLDVNMQVPQAHVKKNTRNAGEIQYVQKPFAERIARIHELKKTHAHITVIVPTDAYKKYVDSLVGGVQVITPIDLYLLDTTPVDLCILEFAGSEYYRHVRKQFDTRMTVRHFCELSGTPLVEMDAILPLHANALVEDAPISLLPEIHIVDQTESKSAKVPKKSVDVRRKRSDTPDDFDMRLMVEQNKAFVSHKKLNLISPELYSLLVYAERQREDVLVYTTRKGLSSTITCPDCGTVLSCSECKKPYSIKILQGIRAYVCPNGHATLPIDTPCLTCGNENLTQLGSGTDALKAEIEDTVSQPIVVVDADHVTQAGARKIFKERMAKTHVPTVYIGTELALHQGLAERFRFGAVASLETLLALPNRLAEFEAARVIESMREKTTEILVLQTRHPLHTVWQSVREKNWRSLVRGAYDEAKSLSLPPFSTYIRLSVSARHRNAFNEMAAMHRHVGRYEHVSVTHMHDEVAGEFLHVYVRAWPDESLYRYLRSLPPHVRIEVDSPSLM